jgi:FixJ family two-component response regulator
VLSVDAIQQHLDVLTPRSSIDVARYLFDLCGTLTQSMVGKERPVTLAVEADSRAVPSRDAVSIGLIVTELVMNALKHAFPAQKPGASIVVSYRMAEPDWTLSVCDNGEGKNPTEPFVGNPGLGARLVDLLAKQLGAEVATVTGPSGTTVSVTHTSSLRAITYAHEGGRNGAGSLDRANDQPHLPRPPMAREQRRKRSRLLLQLEPGPRDPGPSSMTSTPPLATIHVVDDESTVRTSIGRLLHAMGYAVSLYGSAAEFLARPPKPERGCVLLDVQMPALSGPELQDQLTKSGCPLPIIFLSGHGDIPMSVRAIKAGAEDFLAKPVSKEILQEAIERTLRRHDESYERNARINVQRQHALRLTRREREVFNLVVRGRLNRHIAHELGASERTIKAHRHKIMSKFQVGSLAELVSIAEHLGVLEERSVSRRS